MTDAEHKARHEALHKALDELGCDYLLHNPDRLLSNTTVMELAHWSHAQCLNPKPLAADEQSAAALRRAAGSLI